MKHISSSINTRGIRARLALQVHNPAPSHYLAAYIQLFPVYLPCMRRYDLQIHASIVTIMCRELRKTAIADY